MRTNMLSQPAERNFFEEHRNALELPIVQDCNRHVGYANESDGLLLHLQTDQQIDKENIFPPSGPVV